MQPEVERQAVTGARRLVVEDDVSAVFPLWFPRLTYQAEGPPARLQHKLPGDPIRDATHGLVEGLRSRPSC